MGDGTRTARSDGSGGEVRLYVLLAHTPAADLDALRAFTERLRGDLVPHLEEPTGTHWRWYVGEPHRLKNNDSHYASDFLREAHLRMVYRRFQNPLCPISFGG